MISFDQVLLLEQKVESAVAKIAQLNAENAALRTKCAELTNALSAKTEQFSSFQTDQNKIEEGILKALERLNTVENAVLSAASAGQKVQVPETPLPPKEEPVQQPVISETVPQAEITPTFNSEPEIQQPSFKEESIIEEPSFGFDDNQVIQNEPEISVPVIEEEFNTTQSSEQSQPLDPESMTDPNTENNSPIQGNFDIY